MLTGLTIFIVLSILIVIHEVGHFYVAKKSGMKVEEFGFGLPPRLFGKKIGETIYSINLLPIGGFVKILGENPEDLKKVSAADRKRSFSSQPWYKRAAVIVAGPLMNFILAVLVIAYSFTRGVYVPTEQVKVVEVTKQSPAYSAGVRKGAEILSFAGKKIDSSQQIIDLANKYAGKEVIIKFQTNKEAVTKKIIPRKNPPKGQGSLGIVISDIEFKKYPWYQAPVVGLTESVRISTEFYKQIGTALVKLVQFKSPELDVTGPVGIAKVTDQAVKMGLDSVIKLLGLLSLNLALINIIPFPALDGGQLVFVLTEAVTRKKLNENIKAKINAVGFAVLILLIIAITFKDIFNPIF
jgi:regulator of sigma E protease